MHSNIRIMKLALAYLTLSCKTPRNVCLASSLLLGSSSSLFLTSKSSILEKFHSWMLVSLVKPLTVSKDIKADLASQKLSDFFLSLLSPHRFYSSYTNQWGNFRPPDLLQITVESRLQHIPAPLKENNNRNVLAIVNIETYCLEKILAPQRGVVNSYSSKEIAIRLLDPLKIAAPLPTPSPITFGYIVK